MDLTLQYNNIIFFFRNYINVNEVLNGVLILFVHYSLIGSYHLLTVYQQK